MSQPGQQDFSQRLRQLRISKGMTQRDVAGDSLSVSYVSLLESGRRTPTADTIETLARALGCSAAELTGEVDTPAAWPAVLNIRYGQLAIEAGESDAAEKYFASAMSAPGLDPVLRAEARIGAARALEGQGRLQEAAETYESLVNEAVGAPRLLASLNVVISWCRCLMELGELAHAIEVGTGIMQELDRLQAWESDAAVQLLATVAFAHFELGDFGQAERLLREGLEQAERMGSPRARASVLWNASHIAGERGRHLEALELAEEALAHFRHDSDRRSAARLLNAYGYLLLRQDPPRPVEAGRILREALGVLTDCGRGFDRGSVLTELSRAELMQGDADTAADMAERSLAELGPEAVLERARAETAWAAALAAQGRREESGELFARAATTLGGLNASRQAARAWAELGNTLVEAGDPMHAVEAFQQAAASMNLGTVPPAARARSKPAIDSPDPEGS